MNDGHKKSRFIAGFKKFIFEFLIVTLGILAAFTISKWDENNKLAKEEKRAYRSIMSDLRSDLYVLDYYKGFCVRGSEYLGPVLDGNYRQLDSLEYFMKVNFNFQQNDATYVNLKYSGKLDVLENEEIKARLLMYYETYYQGLKSVSQGNRSMTFDIVLPYFIKNVKYGYEPKDLIANLEGDELLNIIGQQTEMLDQNIVSFEKSEFLINQLLDMLEAELEKE